MITGLCARTSSGLSTKMPMFDAQQRCVPVAVLNGGRDPIQNEHLARQSTSWTQATDVGISAARCCSMSNIPPLETATVAPVAHGRHR